MSSLSEGRVPAHPALRWVSTNNPFYVISAGLFLAGLWLSFGDPRRLENVWAMVIGMGAYTLLLAATATFLVRYLNLWDDGRTVLLLVVLMFLATSVTFDELLVVDAVDPQVGTPVRGIVCYVAGLIFAIAVSEGVLRGIRLKLRAGYRVPYYLTLALFFLYPLALTPLLGDAHDERLLWSLFAFSGIAGLIFLTLLPAIRRGSVYVRGNGSPWPWPQYPWSLFVFLATAVVGRAFLLCWSMQAIIGPDINQNIFAPYFLVPFGLALAVLIVEMAKSSGRALLRWIALLVPAGLVALTLIGHHDDPTYREFFDLFSRRLGGDPVFVTLIAAAIFYVYAAMRRIEGAFEGFAAALTLLAIAGTDSLDTGILAEPWPGPLVVAGTLLLGLGVGRRQSWRCLVGALGLTAALLLTFHADAEITPYRGPIALHVCLLIFLTIGAAFEDELARFLRFLGIAIAFLAGLAAAFNPFWFPANVPAWLVSVYPLAMACVVGGYGLMLGYRLAVGAAGTLFACWALASGWQFYRAARTMVAGLDYLAMSVLVFLIAIIVSLAKSGVLWRWLSSRQDRAAE